MFKEYGLEIELMKPYVYKILNTKKEFYITTYEFAEKDVPTRGCLFVWGK